MICRYLSVIGRSLIVAASRVARGPDHGPRPTSGADPRRQPAAAQLADDRDRPSRQEPGPRPAACSLASSVTRWSSSAALREHAPSRWSGLPSDGASGLLRLTRMAESFAGRSPPWGLSRADRGALWQQSVAYCCAAAVMIRTRTATTVAEGSAHCANAVAGPLPPGSGGSSTSGPARPDPAWPRRHAASQARDLEIGADHRAAPSCARGARQGLFIRIATGA
jgi:hypothetical protein